MREGKGWGQAPYEYYYDKKEEQLGMRSNTDELNELNKISKTPSGIMWNEYLVHTRLTTKAYHGVQEKTFAEYLSQVKNQRNLGENSD
ncbi:hypothetical protein [Bacillus haynesii]|uniref:hypothetical protein n=1 Tax=Bacillus haynesii TaxID=1925021 RepID=UPI00227F80BF|nr:hypothetical protein [Bacillus haynesii]MCY8573576.1 hypothetical protein [Bacillus haynesii]